MNLWQYRTTESACHAVICVLTTLTFSLWFILTLTNLFYKNKIIVNIKRKPCFLFPLAFTFHLSRAIFQPSRNLRQVTEVLGDIFSPVYMSLIWKRKIKIYMNRKVVLGSDLWGTGITEDTQFIISFTRSIDIFLNGAL